MTSVHYLSCVAAVNQGHHAVIQDKPETVNYKFKFKISALQVTVMDNIITDATFIQSHHYLKTYSLLYCFTIGQI